MNLDKSDRSGLAVLEIDVPTGYVVMNQTLRDYVLSGVVPNLKRAEFYYRKAVFYFSHVSRKLSKILSEKKPHHILSVTVN